MTASRLTAIKYLGTRKGRHIVLYRCTCGTEKELLREHVVSGKTVSCGCVHREWTKTLGERNTTHGDSDSPEYKAWQSMKTRCLSPTYHCADRYSGRGITVCAEWLNSYETFLADMGRRPNDEYSLDRINNDEGYSKANCRWATALTQSRNRSSK